MTLFCFLSIGHQNPVGAFITSVSLRFAACCRLLGKYAFGVDMNIHAIDPKGINARVRKEAAVFDYRKALHP